MAYFEKVGQLKEYLKTIPDDVLLVKNVQTMEMHGVMCGISNSIINMSKKTKSTYDAFDGTPFKYDVYEEDENGVLCLKFY